MKERAESLGGRLEIVSEVRLGTIAIVKFPGVP